MKEQQLRARLVEALRPKDKTKSIASSAEEMKAVRLECRDHNINYSKMLTEVCLELSASRAKSA